MTTLQSEYWSKINWYTRVDAEAWEQSTRIKVKDLLNEYLGHLPKDTTILDVGCGDGYMIGILNELGFKNVDGMDVNPVSLERAKKRHPKSKFYEIDIYDLNKVLRYDLVFHSGLLIHIHPHYLERVMMNIYAISKRYIFGKEISTSTPTNLGDLAVDTKWRGLLWSRRFQREWLNMFPLKTVKAKFIHSKNKDTTESEVFLLEKENGR